MMKTLTTDSLNDLFGALQKRGFTTVGPRLRDEAIVYDVLESSADLPIGWTDRQEPGRYRVERRKDGAYFGYVVGPQSWKKFLFPPLRRLWSADRSGGGFTTTPEPPPETKYAFLGVRACELAAIGVQDAVFLGGDYVDDVYRTLRERVFVVAVNCVEPGGTCFCVSMGNGPKVTSGFDLALTEIIEGEHHYFTAEVGSDAGAEVLGEVASRDTEKAEQETAERAVEKAVSQMGRTLETAGLRDLLRDSYDHPRWGEVAGRCLTCGNCTMVCPTCFCSTVEDTNDLTGDHAERWRRWDSCFAMDFTYIHGGSVRKSSKSRYRQWMMHKLSTWFDQFGTSGCVGCGRCITWCPVGIDITEEARAIRGSRAKATVDTK